MLLEHLETFSIYIYKNIKRLQSLFFRGTSNLISCMQNYFWLLCKFRPKPEFTAILRLTVITFLNCLSDSNNSFRHCSLSSRLHSFMTLRVTNNPCGVTNIWHSHVTQLHTGSVVCGLCLHIILISEHTL